MTDMYCAVLQAVNEHSPSCGASRSTAGPVPMCEALGGSAGMARSCRTARSAMKHCSLASTTLAVPPDGLRRGRPLNA